MQTNTAKPGVKGIRGIMAISKSVKTKFLLLIDQRKTKERAKKDQSVKKDLDQRKTKTIKLSPYCEDVRGANFFERRNY